MMAAPHAINKPLDIAADELTVSPDTGKATFSGNVQLTQEGITLSAGEINITRDPKTEDIDNITAKKDVSFTFEGGKATGQKAIWTPVTNTIILSGGVTLTQGGNTLSGTTLTYNMATGKANLTSNNKGRVKATFGGKI